jgi:hypothetical protein
MQDKRKGLSLGFLLALGGIVVLIVVLSKATVTSMR